ncbi:hypothetical protein GBT05_12005 [Escherichia coli]|nr:hypothetical protein [Escherichia coli]EFO4661472.1 hypothetical protein [Escherichia coli]NNR14073.1 hypothetical protein [Escherichia coli]NNR32828.1 hypothetical protein [Escherichia coli]NNR52693.1 hypothetical protein [Escherichia coli]
MFTIIRYTLNQLHRIVLTTRQNPGSVHQHATGASKEACKKAGFKMLLSFKPAADRTVTLRCRYPHGWRLPAHPRLPDHHWWRLSRR